MDVDTEAGEAAESEAEAEGGSAAGATAGAAPKACCSVEGDPRVGIAAGLREGWLKRQGTVAEGCMEMVTVNLSQMLAHV